MDTDITGAGWSEPEFMKQELLSKDPVVRLRAEETLSAMIAAALASTNDPQDI